MERAEGIEVLIPVDEDDITVGPSDQRNEAVHDAPNWSPGRTGLHETSPACMKEFTDGSASDGRPRKIRIHSDESGRSMFVRVMTSKYAFDV